MGGLAPAIISYGAQNGRAKRSVGQWAKRRGGGGRARRADARPCVKAGVRPDGKTLALLSHWPVYAGRDCQDGEGHAAGEELRDAEESVSERTPQ